MASWGPHSTKRFLPSGPGFESRVYLNPSSAHTRAYTKEGLKVGTSKNEQLFSLQPYTLNLWMFLGSNQASCVAS